MFMIIIHVFQMDIICILIKYYFHVHDHNAVLQMDIICILIKYYFTIMYFQNYLICILMKYCFKS